MNINNVFVVSHFNDDFYYIAPKCSIWICFNLVGWNGFVDKNAPDIILGEKILCAFARSIELSTLKKLDWIVNNIDYDAWVLECMKIFGYKTKRTMFKNMESCSLKSDSECGRIFFEPMRHYKLQAWETKKGDEKYEISISADSDPELIGKTLRLALENSKIMSGRSWSFSKHLRTKKRGQE